MRPVTKSFLFLIITMVIAGCTSFPEFRSGIVPREYMLELLPDSGDFQFLFDFRRIEEGSQFARNLFLAVNENTDLGNFINDYNIDLLKDLYSISFAISIGQTENKSMKLTMVINLEYDMEVIRRALLKNGYREETVDPYSLPLFSNIESNDEYQLLFLSKNLILISTRTIVNTVLDKQYNKRTGNKTRKPFLDAMKKKSLDAPFIFFIHNISKFLTNTAENPILNLFMNIDELIICLDSTSTEIIIDAFLFIKDIQQREIFYGILALGIQESERVEDKTAREILKHMSISRDKTGIKLTTIIPFRVFQTIFEKYRDISI